MSSKYREEIFQLVDKEGNPIGTAPRSICHNGESMLLHSVVHLHLFNSSGKLFLQKRSKSKDIQPGKWDTSAGGHISPGESVEEALAREVKEEIGITNFNPKFMGNYIWESPVEREFVHSFSTVSDLIPLINENEIEDGRFWSMQAIKINIGKDLFTPNFEAEFGKFLSL
jgi:isopentenyldiphosphate isomerase